MRTTKELLETHKKLVAALAENASLREDMNELECYVLELQTEIEELLNKLGDI